MNSHLLDAGTKGFNYSNNIRKNSKMSYDRFVDDRLLTSRDVLNKKQIKMKLIDIDESARDFSQRFGNRILVRKVLLTIKQTDTEEIEEKELDVEELEKRVRKERLFSSSNRWISKHEIKNGYIVASKHLDLLASAIALDIIQF
jgi:NH3-dependent NAD+ synthetase